MDSLTFHIYGYAIAIYKSYSPAQRSEVIEVFIHPYTQILHVTHYIDLFDKACVTSELKRISGFYLYLKLSQSLSMCW